MLSRLPLQLGDLVPNTRLLPKAWIMNSEIMMVENVTSVPEK